MSQSEDIILNVGLRAFSYAGSSPLSLPSFTVARGQIVLLTGRSGCGKSTLLNLVSGVQALSPEQGSIRIAGTELAGAAQHRRDQLRPQTVGWMPQRVHLISALSVFDNVMLPLRVGMTDIDANTAANRGRSLMDALEIGALANTPATQISVGQASRACAARALAVNPRLLCADEPSAALDQTSAAILARVIADFVKGGGAALVASHDRAFATALQREHESVVTISLEAQ